MNKRQQQKFIQFFDQLCQAQQIIDRLKIDLTHRKNYNPHLIFQLLSQGNQIIIISQFRSYLANRIQCTHRQLYQIFEKFDSKRNGYISKEDFIRQLTPFKSEPTQQYNQGVLNSQIQTSFLQIIIQLLKRFRIIQEARKQIVSIQPYQAFAHLDCWKKGIIGLGDLQRFYKDNDFAIQQSSLEFLLHALRRRYHRDVTLQLFCQNLNPLQFGQYKNFATQMSKQNQIQFLKRSRNQQEAVRRSRIDNQHLQYEIQRAQRRKKAQIQRQLNIQQRINLELSGYQKSQQQIIQKALLEQQRDIRNRSLQQNSILQRQYNRAAEQSRRIRQIQAIKQQQRLISDNLSRKLAQKSAQSASKQRFLNDNQNSVKNQIQREKQTRNLYLRAVDQQLSRSRKQYEEDVRRDRSARLGQMQRQKLIQSYHPQVSSLSRSIKQSRIQDLQYQLQKTRMEMRQRRERLQRQEKLRLLQTASKSRISAFPY